MKNFIIVRNSYSGTKIMGEHYAQSGQFIPLTDLEIL